VQKLFIGGQHIYKLTRRKMIMHGKFLTPEFCKRFISNEPVAKLIGVSQGATKHGA
jgi:hypothetical protein